MLLYLRPNPNGYVNNRGASAMTSFIHALMRMFTALVGGKHLESDGHHSITYVPGTAPLTEMRIVVHDVHDVHDATIAEHSHTGHDVHDDTGQQLTDATIAETDDIERATRLDDELDPKVLADIQRFAGDPDIQRASQAYVDAVAV